MSVTIKQIAELANVSRGTVDKVLNNRGGVKPSTQEKVLRIAKELNYHPNLLGKALVQSKTPLKLGVILTADYNPFIHEILAGIQKAQEEFAPFGIEIITKMLTTLEPAEQLSIINDLVNQNVTGMAVFPIDDIQIISRVNQLAENNIAIVTFNSKVPDINSLCFVGQNHYKGGRTAAQLLYKLLRKELKVGVIVSSRNLSCHKDRLKGFIDRMKENVFPVTIVDVQENQDHKEDAFRITLEYCNKYPDLDAIYITGGGVAGVGSALDIANRRENVRVICHDLTPDSRELLHEDLLDFVLDQNPEEQGYLIIKVLFDYCMKGITPPNQIDIPITIAVNESL